MLNSNNPALQCSFGEKCSRDVLLNRPDAATFLGVQPQTLAAWACTQRYPLPYVKIGRRVMYRLADLEAFVVANRHNARKVAA